MVVRGCVPVQSGNPYYKSGCVSMSDDTDPYVRAIVEDLYSVQNGVGPVPGTVQGSFCMCSGNRCNHAAGRLAAEGGKMAAALMLMMMFL